MSTRPTIEEVLLDYIVRFGLTDLARAYYLETSGSQEVDPISDREDGPAS